MKNHQPTYTMNRCSLALVLAAALAASASLPLSARADGRTVRPQKAPRRAHTVLQGYIAAPERVNVTGTLPKEEQQLPHNRGYFVQSATADATGASEGQTVNRAINDLN